MVVKICTFAAKAHGRLTNLALGRLKRCPVFFHPLPSREGCTGNVQIIFCRAKHRKHVLFLFLSVSKVDLFRVYIFVD